MKNVLRIIAISAIAALFALPAFAQDPAPSASPAASAQDTQAKAELYNKWLENYKGDANKQKVAYEAGKEFLSKYGSQPDEYVTAVQKWVTKYENAVGKFQIQQNYQQALKAAQTSKDYASLFTAGKALVAAEPDNTQVILTLSNAGLLNATEKTGNKSLNPDAVAFTRRAIELVEAGKGTPEDLKTINSAVSNKEDALGWLHYRLGLFTRETAPDDAVNHFLKAAQSTGTAKSEPSLYAYLAQAYADGDFKRAVAAYKPFEGQPETPEGKVALAKLNQSFDRIIDAYARAAALYTKPEQKAYRDSLMATLTDLYKQRHDGSDAGLTEFVAGSASRRLPLPSDPLPVEPAPAATPAANGTPAGATSPATGTTMTTTTTKPAATTPPATAPKPATKPATDTPPKPGSKPIAAAKPATKPVR